MQWHFILRHCKWLLQWSWVSSIFINPLLNVGFMERVNIKMLNYQSRPSEAREALVAYQEIQERRLTPPPWLDQLRSKFRNIVRAGAAPMCTKKKFQKYLPKKYGCVTYLQPCVFNERALRDEASACGRAIKASQIPAILGNRYSGVQTFLLCRINF